MSEEKAKEILIAKAANGKLTCAQAFKIAEETGISRSRMGEILNEMKIKIVSCQLGCFE